MILEYTDLFDSYSDNVKFTLDGTLNYVLSLLVSEIDKLEQAYEFNQIHNWFTLYNMHNMGDDLTLFLCV